MDLEDRTDGVYMLGRKLVAYKIPDSTILQVDLCLTSRDCPEGRVGEAILECPGDCQNTYLTFLFRGDELVTIGELSNAHETYVHMDVVAQYGVHDLINVDSLLRKPNLRLRSVQHGRGIEVLIDEQILLTYFKKCTFYRSTAGFERVYTAELSCITANFDRIRDSAIEGWPPEVIRARARMD